MPTTDQADPGRELFHRIDRELGFARILGEPVSVTWALLVFNVVVYAAAFFWAFSLEGTAFRFDYYQPFQIALYPGMKVNPAIDAGQLWRLPSSVFVHLSFAHIAFNGYGLYVLGPLVEKFFGARRFFSLYMMAGILAAAASYFFTDTAAAGASGAIYGLVGALAVIGWKYRSELPERVSRTFTTGMAPWVVIGIGIGFLDAVPFDNAAHIGGLLSGALAAAIFKPRLERRPSRAGDHATTALTVVFLLICVWTLVEWTAEFERCLPDHDAFLECYPETGGQV